ncbi:MAG TPA: hypothetical protein VG452_07355 [Egibacteraceae bacterium]|nr:hypothetical protein [Egibacteraceae bacterium]
MSRETSERHWRRRAGGLTIQPEGDWPHDQLLAARILVDRLAALARALVDQPCCAADGEGCQLDDVPGGRQACELLADLARLVPPDAAVHASRTGRELARRYLQAIRDASGAVYFCRRVEHACGRCWFSPEGPGADVCAAVLAVSHRLQTPAASRS